MKTSTTPVIFALIGFFVASQPLLAAPKKTDERNSALVAALQAVSPDPLGGRLGLSATAALTPNTSTGATVGKRENPMRLPNAAYDQRAYVIWKSSVKG